MKNAHRIILVLAAVGSLASCGGGGDDPAPPPPPPPPPTSTYTIGGTVSGVTGAGLVLRNNGANNLTIVADGSFTFSSPIAAGGAYSVSVLTHSTGQSCVVTAGSGSVSSANITNVLIACSALPTIQAVADALVSAASVSWTSVGAAQFNIYASSDANCNTANYSSCADGSMRPNVSSPTRVSTLTNGRTHYFVVEAVLASGARAYSNVVGARPNTLAVNGTVKAMDRAPNGVLYLGGSFTRIGIYSGGGAPINATTGRPTVPNFSIVEGVVNIAAFDATGGVYIHGSFARVGGVARQNYAHLLADGTVDPNWAPQIDGQSFGIVVSGTTVYLAGDFANVNGVARPYLAAVNASGALTSFNPVVDHPVRGMALSGDTLYLIGSFQMVGGLPRDRVAAVGLDGTMRNWQPLLDTSVDLNPRALAVSGSNVHIGCEYYDDDSIPHVRLSVIDANGIVTDRNDIEGYLWTLLMHNNVLYIAGEFWAIDGNVRHGLAAVNAAGAVTSWNPDISAGVATSLAGVGSTIYVGGEFDAVDGVARSNAVAIDISGALTTWNPIFDSAVLTVANNGNTIYAGGNFRSVNSAVRMSLAALDTNGDITGWNPGADSYVDDVAVAGSAVAVVGSFTNVGGQPRNYLASIDFNGAVTSWDPNPNSNPYALATSSDRLYVGGFFANIAGSPQRHLAAFDFSGALLPWYPVVDQPVGAIAPLGTDVFIGGRFTSVNGVSRNNAAVLSASGSLGAWNPNVGSTPYSTFVSAIFASGNTVYLGGYFDRIGTASRANVGAVDLAGNVLPWNPGSNSYVRKIHAVGNNVYLGGEFSVVGAASRWGIAAVSTSGNLLPWTGGLTSRPFISAPVYDLDIYSGSAWLGGGFEFVNGEPQSNFAVVPAAP